MGILEGAVLSVLTQIIKKATNKFGAEMTTAAIYILSIVAAIGYTVGVGLESGSLEIGSMAAQAGTIWVSSIGVYELLIKRTINPLLNKMSK